MKWLTILIEFDLFPYILGYFHLINDKHYYRIVDDPMIPKKVGICSNLPNKFYLDSFFHMQFPFEFNEVQIF